MCTAVLKKCTQCCTLRVICLSLFQWFINFYGLSFCTYIQEIVLVCFGCAVLKKCTQWTLKYLFVFQGFLNFLWTLLLYLYSRICALQRQGMNFRSTGKFYQSSSRKWLDFQTNDLRRRSCYFAGDDSARLLKSREPKTKISYSSLHFYLRCCSVACIRPASPIRIDSFCKNHPRDKE